MMRNNGMGVYCYDQFAYLCGMKAIKLTYAPLFFSLMVIVGCSEFSKLQKSSDFELKYTKAVEYFDEGDYFKAQTLFEELKPMYIGTNKGEKIHWYYAMTYYHENDWLLAAYHFKTYAKTYPISDSVAKAMYLTGYCLYQTAPVYMLDQYLTRKAIEAFQLFINKFPMSERVPEANTYMDALRKKLETKSYKAAKLYYDLEKYEAAIISFDNCLKDYPDTDFREEIMFYTVASYYEWADGSIEEKKPERMEKVLEEYNTFVNNYPESPKRSDADKIVEKAEGFLRGNSQ